MLLQQVAVKLFVQPDSSPELDVFTPIFHSWIQQKRIADQLLIDVADYRHVPNGPGVMLIANEAHYGMDSTGGELGLRYLSRRDTPREAKDALRDALKRVTQVASYIEAEPSLGGKLRFRTSDLQMRVMSRLLAPNTEATRLSIEPIWSGLLLESGFAGIEVEPERDPRSPFGLRVCACAASPDLAGLVAAL